MVSAMATNKKTEGAQRNRNRKAPKQKAQKGTPPTSGGWKLPRGKRAKIVIKTYPLEELADHPRNVEVRKHPEPGSSRWEVMVESLKHDYFDPLVWNKRNGQLVSGHLRKKILLHLGFVTADVVVVDYDEPTHIARLLAANKGIGSDDIEGQKAFFLELSEIKGFDISGLSGFTMKEVKPLLKVKNADSPTDEQVGSLARRFMIPPFTVLDAKQGWWQDRKREWTALLELDSVEGRDDALTFGAGSDATANRMQEVGRTSTFDPVLCELAYTWFSGKGGTVLDPFAGGSVRGLMAAKLGRKYVGVDLRKEQVDANKQQWKDLPDRTSALGGAAKAPKWITGDSRNVGRLCKGTKADLVFSCPPYADLEVYSDDPKDLSNLKYDEFLTAYRAIIAQSCKLLKKDRFAVFVVGEVRGPKGPYYNFVGDTVNAFIDAGLEYYNEGILVTPPGSLPLRAGKPFETSRKLGKAHQNVLVFCKGDAKRAATACGDVQIAQALEATLEG